MHPYLTQWYQWCPHCKARLAPQGEGLGCVECGFRCYANPAPSVTVFVEHWPAGASEPMVLLGRREREPFKGSWDLLGGFLLPSETSAEAVIREVKEECGLDVTVTAYLGDTTDIYQGAPTLPLVFVANSLTMGGTAADDVNHLEWFSASNIPEEIAFTHTKTALEWYYAYLDSMEPV